MGRRRTVILDVATAVVCTRNDASIAGRKHYFDGKPCANGHISYRYVSTGACLECLRPPAPVSSYLGDSVNARFVYRPKLRLGAMPALHELKMFDVALENAARKWLIEMAYLPKPSDDD